MPCTATPLTRAAESLPPMDAGVRQKILVVNVDYVGSCSGSCPVCALSDEERASTRPFLTPGQVQNVFRQIHQRGYVLCEDLVLAMGRGNMLDVGDDIIEQLNAVAADAVNWFSFERGLMEISTSLMGKLSEQIERAERIIERFRQADHGIQPRFTIVANAANTSPSYWRHLRQFTDHMAAVRGNRDGDGDILLINLSLGHLPPVDKLIEYLDGYRSPINLTWAPMLDAAGDKPEAYEELENWLAAWYAAASASDLDSSLVNRTRECMAFDAMDTDELKLHMMSHGNKLLYVDSSGMLHHGFTSICADMDPVRFQQVPVQDQNGSMRMIASPDQELAELLKFSACRGCAHLKSCVVSGSYKIALLNDQRLPRRSHACPSGMRSVFAYQQQHADDTVRRFA